MQIVIEFSDKYDEEKVFYAVVSALVAHAKLSMEEKVFKLVTEEINKEFRTLVRERTRQVLERWSVTIEDKPLDLNEYIGYLLQRLKPRAPFYPSSYEQRHTYIQHVMESVLEATTKEHLKEVLLPYSVQLKEALKKKLGDMLVEEVMHR